MLVMQLIEVVGVVTFGIGLTGIWYDLLTGD